MATGSKFRFERSPMIDIVERLRGFLTLEESDLKAAADEIARLRNTAALLKIIYDRYRQRLPRHLIGEIEECLGPGKDPWKEEP
jgi:hypothetical protein